VFPIARRANREQPRASAWLKPWERHAPGNRPERAAESTLTTTYGYVVVIFDAPVPFHLMVHAVFSTKDRRPFLHAEEIRIETYAYRAGILKNLQCHPIKIGGVDDHVHMLSSLSKNTAFADMIGRVKGSCSKRLREKGSSALRGKMDTELSQ
jgi:REP element-mobilizing transposase RayT